MMGEEGKGHHPHDVDDFQRCRKLLMMMPEWRNSIHKMKDVSPIWSKLADHWDELDALYDQIEEAGAAEKMNSLINTLTR